MKQSGTVVYATSVRAGRPTRVRRVLVAFVVLAAAAAMGRAADADTIIFPANGPAANKSAGAAITGGLNSLTLVVAAIVAGAGGWVLWRGRRRTSAGLVPRALAVDETRPLGNRQYLVVASYEGRKFLLGVCPGRIDLLARLTESSARRME